MINKMLKNPKFESYFNLFNSRFSFGSLSVEDSSINLASLKRARAVFNNQRAYTYLFENIGDGQKIFPYVIQNVASIVNEEIAFCADGYRKVESIIAGANFEIESPRNIPMAMMCLIDNYYNVWCDMDPYEREARFHIDFIRIHPFEDGNGRTGRIIMNYNLFTQNLAPVVIDSDERKVYFKFIEDKDYIGFAQFLKEKSLGEQELFEELFEIEEEKKY